MRTRLLFLSSAFVLVVAACGGGGDEPAGGAQEPAGEAGDGQFDGTITFGAAVSETGKYAREGKDTRQGYEVWLDWVNNEYGGIKLGDERYEVELIMYDDEGDPDTASRLVEKLITDDGVEVILGPYSSSLTQSTSAITEKHDVVMVEGNGASDALFERGFQNLFATLTPGSAYTHSGLDLLAEKGAESVVVAYEDTSFPTSVGQGAVAKAEELGMEVLAVETYPKDIADVSAIMTKFRDLDPDVFVGGGHFNDAVLFIKSAREVGFSPKGMLITVGPSNPELVAEVGADAEFILGPTQWESVMTWQDEWFGTAEEFARRYEEMHGEAPTYQAAESTAAALVLQLGIERAGSLETEAIRQALRELEVETFYGPIDFDETGKNIAKQMGTIQIQDGEIKVVAPGEVAVADIIYPMPAWDER